MGEREEVPDRPVPRRVRRALLLLAAACAVSACPRPTTPPRAATTDVRVERHRQYNAAAERLLTHMERVSRVGARVTVAAAPFCGDEVKPFVGIVSASGASVARQLGQHAAWVDTSAALRDAWDLDDSPEVLAVLPGSPAERAGILPGDRVMTLGPESDHADSALLIEVERAHREIHARLPYVAECAYGVFVTFGDLVNAHLRGETVLITTGLLRFVESDDELAMVIGHELAHRILGHRRTALRSHERAADYLGVYIAARAGYDPGAAVTFVRRLAAEHPELISERASPVHPGTADRVAALQLAIAEIHAKQSRGDPLVPGPLAGL